jgi:hypothetical protein
MSLDHSHHRPLRCNPRGRRVRHLTTNNDDMTAADLAKLAGCSPSTVKLACKHGEITGARREIVDNSVAWRIPSQAGEKWAKGRIPFATQRGKRGQLKPITANTNRRSLPAESSVPVTGDEQPPEDET